MQPCPPWPPPPPPQSISSAAQDHTNASAEATAAAVSNGGRSAGASATPDGSSRLGLLLAPQGQLSGDGQLRELIQEHREHKGAEAAIWFLPPAVVRQLGLGPAGEEAVAAADPATLTWLQLRFGGAIRPCDLQPETLTQQAAALPPAAPLAAVALAPSGRN
ncbi:hypothetical protein [Vulcanococcus limneticus]|uniref:hypothetical protein n=1 Tax=Vulcanococcus limneticus TaxID=2170428 RepID=UPI00398BCCDA